MKLNRSLALLLAGMLLLTGCGGKSAGSSSPAASAPQTPPALSTPQTQPAVSTPKAELDTQDPSLTRLLEQLPEGTLIAVAYLGYAQLTDYSDLTVYLEANGLYDQFPFLSHVTREQFAQNEGGELYAVIPASEQVCVTVSDCYPDMTSYVVVPDQELLAGDYGQVLLLQGNVSEVAPNLHLTVWDEGDEPMEYLPSLSLMDGSLAAQEGVWDATPYQVLDRIWQEQSSTDSALLWGSWFTRAADGDGNLYDLQLDLWSDGTANYCCSWIEGVPAEVFEGTWSAADDMLTLELYGGAADSDGFYLDEYAYERTSSFLWSYQDRALILQHTSGDTMLYGTEGGDFVWQPFNTHTLANNWYAEGAQQELTYSLLLLDDTQCFFTISDYQEQLAQYEGWWYLSQEGYLSLEMSLVWGEHPEQPELDYFYGTYLAEETAQGLVLTYDSGEILTLNMEENGYELLTAPNTTPVSVHYAEDVAADWSDLDWVIVDDTDPALEVAFCTMVPLEDFEVVSLFLEGISDDGTQMYYDISPLFDYGTLTPERPLKVVLTIYGDLPTYGVSFTDADGVQRIYGVTLSGMDGSLQLIEI